MEKVDKQFGLTTLALKNRTTVIVLTILVVILGVTTYITGSSIYHFGSSWIVVGRRREDLEPMVSDPRWHPLEEKPGVSMWTDDYSNVFRVLDW